MSKTWMAFVATLLALTFAAVTWAVELQNPDAGEAPHGFAYADDAQGAQVAVVIAFEFRDVPDECFLNDDDVEIPTDTVAPGSAQMISVLRARKAGRLAAFSHVTTCASCPDACEEFPVCGTLPDGMDLVAQSHIADIQECLIDDLKEALGEALFDDPDVDVKLKGVKEFVQALPTPTRVDPDLDPAIANSDHFVADLQLSVK